MIGKGKNARGKRGEDLAADYLAARGHTVLARNWHGGHLELDIVTEAPDGVHFVEVKTRTAPVAAAPEENVGRLKQQRITAAALKFLHAMDSRFEREVFFDVVAVLFDGGKVEINYFPQAWIPMYT